MDVGRVVKALASPDARPVVVSALDRALAAGGVGALDPAVPVALWHRALAGPARGFLARPGKELRARLVHAGWTLGGGAPDALPDRLALALEILHAGSLIIDDVEDGAELRRGAPALHHQIGVPLAINTGSWLYFWALAELGQVGLPPERELDAHRLAVSTLVRAHQGQALDLATCVDELDPVQVAPVVDAVARLKTGSLCRFAAELGALAAGAAPATRAAVARFGETAGLALQMLDDLGAIASGARRAKAHEDLRGARPTWPWAWLVEREPFAWTRLTQLLRAVRADEIAPDVVADALAELVVPHGRARVRAMQTVALDELAAALGASAALDAVAADFRHMEASYG